MKQFRLKINDEWVELTERPKVYVFTDETCSKMRYVPLSLAKLKENQKWVDKKRENDPTFNYDYKPTDIIFELKNSEDCNKFSKLIPDNKEVILKKDHVTTLQYMQLKENSEIEDTIFFFNCLLMEIAGTTIEIITDHMIEESGGMS